MTAPVRDPLPVYTGPPAGPAHKRWIEAFGGIAVLTALIGVGRWSQKVEDRQERLDNGTHAVTVAPAGGAESLRSGSGRASSSGQSGSSEPHDASAVRPIVDCDDVGLRLITPRAGSMVSTSERATGDVGKLPKGAHAWVLARRSDFSPLWWPQRETQGPRWSAEVSFGGPQDAGHEFDLAVVIVDEREHQRLYEHWVKAMESKEWTPIPVETLCEATHKLKRR